MTITRLTLTCFFIAILIGCVRSFVEEDESYDDVFTTVHLLGLVSYSTLQAVEDVVVAYKLVQSNLHIEVAPAISSAALSDLVTGATDFAVTLASLPYAITQSTPSVQMVPLLLGGLVPVYNLPSIPTGLVLSRSALVLIYMSEITRWNDPRIQSTNKWITLPNENIRLVLETETSAMTFIIKRAFYQFYPAIRTESNITLSPLADWPYSQYPVHPQLVAGSLTGLASTVTATPYSLGMTYYSIATLLRSPVASLINSAGSIVQPSLSSLTLAALDLGVNTDTSRTMMTSLIDSSNPSAWPLTFIAYLAIDTQFSRTSCRARSELVRLWLYFYQSSVVAKLLPTRGYAPIPDVLINQQSIISWLSFQVMCSDVPALPSSSTSSRKLGSGPSLSFMARLLSTVYDDPTNQAVWKAKVSSDRTLAQRLYDSEIDVALINPADLDPALWHQLLLTDQFLILPTFATALSMLINKHVTSTHTIPDNLPYVLTIDLIAETQGLCISDHLDPKVVALNPWLPAALGNESAPIVNVIVCGNTATAFIRRYFENKIRQLGQQNPNSPGYQCFLESVFPDFVQNDIIGCLAPPPEANIPLLLIPPTNEQLLNAVILGSIGAEGMTYVDGDANKLFASLVVERNGVSKVLYGDVDHMLACASDTFDPITLSFDFTASLNDSCWPMVQQSMIVVRRQYWSSKTVTNSSSCVAGLQSLRFVRWLLSISEINALSASSNVARLTNIPGVLDAYLAALNTVMCDDDTLLTALPIVWTLSGALRNLCLTLAVIGLMVVIVFTVGAIVFRNQPSISFTSLPIILTSLTGAASMFVACILLVLPVADETCAAQGPTIVLGTQLLFTPMFVKAFKAYRDFSRRRSTTVRINTRRQQFWVAILIAFDVIIVIAWTAVAPMRPILTELESSARVHQYNQCWPPPSSLVFVAVLMVEKIGLFVLSSLMAFAARSIKTPFHDAEHVRLILLNALFSIVLVTIILWVVNAIGTVLLILPVLLFLWLTYFTIALFVGSKLLAARRARQVGDAESAHIAASLSPTHVSTGFNFPTLSQLDTLQALENYKAALYSHTQDVNALVAKLQSSPRPSTTAAGLRNVRKSLMSPVETFRASKSQKRTSTFSAVE